MSSIESHSSLISRIPWPLRALGAPLYWLGYQGHRGLYRWGLKSSVRLPAPVICVGNLTVGGSGKTPVVIALAQLLEAMGKRVGVLSRGYLRQDRSKEPVVVSDGQRLLSSVEEAGDEPLMIAEQAPQAVVIVHPDRAAAGRLALEKYHCDVLLLDDGFQHWALKRDIDLVCVDSTLPLERAHLLPWGPYREPVSALRRASAILLTQPADPGAINRQEDFLKRYGFADSLPVWRAQIRPTGLIAFHDGRSEPPSLLAEKRVIGACGIARPSHFQETLKTLKPDLCDFISLPDHDSFSDQSIRRIEEAARNNQAELIVVTAKDFVKLKGRVDAKAPWRYLRVAVSWSQEQEAAIRSFLHAELERARK